jgi:UDP-N-acetylmuramoyl-tripeptide--D-alanyl-D-alanine ligase
MTARISTTLGDLATATAGRLIGASVPFESVSIDSRTLELGALFVALRGPTFDGHEFVAAAAQRGASGALVERELSVPIPQVLVENSERALTEFARTWRRQMSIPVIGITGSNGKTTTKEMIGAILSRHHKCLVTQGNLNNHLGVPLTLLRLRADHDVAVIEMGANHQGEIAALADIAEPTIGIVTNAGAAHLEGFGGLSGVAKGKGELFRALGQSGTAIINADDAFAQFWRDNSAAGQTGTFGLEQASDFTARDVRGAQAGQAGFAFELVTPLGARAATLSLAGTHNLRNALGAAAAAHAGGASLDDIVGGLADMRPVAGRLQLLPAIHGAFLLDDSYNANPSSLRAGLDAMFALPDANAEERWLVLGDMLELGDGADRLHAEMGVYAREIGINRLFAVGPRARFAAGAFGSGAEWFADVETLISTLQTLLKPRVTVLIKGSRANRLERVSAALSLGGAVSGH